MSSDGRSHRHDVNAATQNQGNTLGDRPCVRQSRYFRQYESGNAVKGLLGCSHLEWSVDVPKRGQRAEPAGQLSRRVEK